MIDFDHPVVSMRREVYDILERYGFKGNLFIYTSPYDPDYPRPLALAQVPEHMPWSEVRELRGLGWHIGAHTISHPNLSNLAAEDPEGEVLREELDRCNRVIEENLGFVPQDFAFTGTSWSSAAEIEVKKGTGLGGYGSSAPSMRPTGSPYATPNWRGQQNPTRPTAARPTAHGTSLNIPTPTACRPWNFRPSSTTMTPFAGTWKARSKIKSLALIR